MSLIPASLLPTFNPTGPVDVTTTASGESTLYIKAYHEGILSPFVTKTSTLIVCENEVIAAATTGDVVLQYQVGASESIPDVQTLFSSYFTSSPANSAVPECNQVAFTLHADSAGATPWTGTAIIPASQTQPWDMTASSSIVTTSSQTSTVYVKGCHAGTTASCVIVKVDINVCSSETVALVNPGPEDKLYELGGSITIANWETMVAGYFVSTPANSAVPACNVVQVIAYSDVGLTTVLNAGNAIVTESLSFSSWD